MEESILSAADILVEKRRLVVAYRDACSTEDEPLKKQALTAMLDYEMDEAEIVQLLLKIDQEEDVHNEGVASCTTIALLPICERIGINLMQVVEPFIDNDEQE